MTRAWEPPHATRYSRNGMRIVLLASAAMFVGLTAAYAAEKPISVTLATGTSTATVSGKAGNRWHVAATTRPRGLRVLVRVAGRPDRVGKSPIRLEYSCASCRARATAKLLPTGGKLVPPTATLTVSLYRG